MKVYKVTDPEFKEYGQVLENYDYTELLEKLKGLPSKKILFLYQASHPELEGCAIKQEFQRRGFGGIPIQIGYVAGHCHVLNCLEYHKSSEFNIALDDVVLIVGKKEDITDDGKYDLKNCKAFHLPAGVGVEIYSTTLHFAPFHMNDEFRVACVLPVGTNTLGEPFEKTDSLEDKMYAARNKWMMCHEYTDYVETSYQGLEGKKIIFDMLEF